MKEKILVSACLLGANCKYDGKNNKNNGVISLKSKYELIPVCPETLGGLKAPRCPSELRGGRVFAKDGTDVTEYFINGAEKTLETAKRNGCSRAVLKARSPSCGSKAIYDGSFSGKVIGGDGVAARILKDNGIKVYTENELEELD
ncbi:MAG: DUF523 domain-containing protein [Acutalibacteraceae bacterium]